MKTDAAAHADTGNPPPSQPPLEAAAHHAIGHLVEIEKELKKGAAASPLSGSILAAAQSITLASLK